MLQELRKKPKNVREKYAFWGAFLVTAVIAIVWGISLSVQLGVFQETTLSEETIQKPESSGAFSRSFSDVKDNVAGAWSAFTTDSETDNKATSTEEVVTKTSVEFSSTTTATSSEIVKPKASNQRAVLIATTTIIMESDNE